MVFISGLLLYDCALELAAHFLSKHCLIRTLAKSTAWQDTFLRLSRSTVCTPGRAKGSHKLTNQPGESKLYLMEANSLRTTTTTGCIDPNPYFPICSGLGGFSGHATPSLTTSSKNSIILLAPILIFSFVCRLKVTLARGRLESFDSCLNKTPADVSDSVFVKLK